MCEKHIVAQRPILQNSCSAGSALYQHPSLPLPCPHPQVPDTRTCISIQPDQAQYQALYRGGRPSAPRWCLCTHPHSHAVACNGCQFVLPRTLIKGSTQGQGRVACNTSPGHEEVGLETLLSSRLTSYARACEERGSGPCLFSGARRHRVRRARCSNRENSALVSSLIISDTRRGLAIATWAEGGGRRGRVGASPVRRHGPNHG